jgi:hypothetical protein
MKCLKRKTDKRKRDVQRKGHRKTQREKDRDGAKRGRGR